MVTVSVIVDKKAQRYRGISNALMRGFTIIYFDIRPLINEETSIRDLLQRIILTAKFVGEDLPEEYALNIITYLRNNCNSFLELEEKLIFVMNDGKSFLEFFENELSRALSNEYLELLKRSGGER